MISPSSRRWYVLLIPPTHETSFHTLQFGFGTNLNPSPLSLRRVVIPTGSPDPCNKGGRDDLVQDAGAGSVAVGNTNRAYPSTDGIVYKRVGMGTCHCVSIGQPPTKLGRLGQHQMNNTVNKNPCEIIEILDSWCLDLSTCPTPTRSGSKSRSIVWED